MMSMRSVPHIVGDAKSGWLCSASNDRWMKVAMAEIQRRQVEPGESVFDQQWYDDMVEQAKGYLENQLQVPAEEVQQQFRVRLDAEYPTPQIGQVAMTVIRAHYREGDAESWVRILNAEELDAKARSEALDYLRWTKRRSRQLVLWAWYERMWLFFDGQFYETQPADPPGADLLQWLGATDSTTNKSALSYHPTIHAYGPVLTGMEGIWGFAEATNIVRDKRRPPHVITSNGGMVSVGGDSTTVMDGTQEAAAFAAGLKLSDDTAAGFVLGLARWCERGNRQDRRSYAVVTVDEYCQARGWKKHPNGGYKTEHKAKARDEMMALNKVWVRHKVPDWLVTNDGTRYIEGPLMMVSRGSSDKSGRNTTAFRVSPGTWANDYLEDNPNCTALVLENVLRLDTRSRRGQIAQRLGLYMALQWRTKFLHNNGGQAHRIATLLTAVGIDPKTITNREERRRIRSYLTGEGSALDQLQDVGAIGTRDDAGTLVDDWRYKNEEASDPDADASWDAWLEWTIIIPAPSDVMDFYRIPQIARHAALKEGVARERRKERARDAAQARRIAEKD